jgi:hypothetical protein
MAGSKPLASCQAVPRAFKRATLAALASLLAASCLLDPKSDDLPMSSGIDVNGDLPSTNTPPDDAPALSGDHGPNNLVDTGEPTVNPGTSPEAVDAGASSLSTLSTSDAAATPLSIEEQDAGADDPELAE